jgi:hypothetical protein
MSKLPRTCLCAFILALTVPMFGCDDGAVDRIENRLDCRGICNEYHDCIDDSTDLEECRESCVDKALEDDDWENKVDNCSDCVSEDDSCTEKTFQCAADCVGIVP